MCSYEFIKTLNLHYMLGCEIKMITICMHVHACAHVHTLHTHDRHTHRVKMTLCGHNEMKVLPERQENYVRTWTELFGSGRVKWPAPKNIIINLQVSACNFPSILALWY